MSLVMTLIAGQGAEPVLPDRVAAIRNALSAGGPDWLAPKHACDLLISDGDAAKAEAAARQVATCIVPGGDHDRVATPGGWWDIRRRGRFGYRNGGTRSKNVEPLSS